MGFPSIPVRGFAFTSATLADFGEAAETGDVAYDSKGRSFILVNAGATIADGALCMAKTGQTTTGVTTPYVVILTTGIAVAAVCVNNTGAAITSGHYFWALTGNCAGYALGAGTIGDGVAVMPAASGTGAMDVAAGATATLCGVTISDATTTVANRVHWNLPAIGDIES